MEEGVKGEGGDGQGDSEHIVACTIIVAGGTSTASTASTDNQRGLLPAINQARKCRIIPLQQRPKTHLACHSRKCTLYSLDCWTLSTAGLQNKIYRRTAWMSGSHASTVSTLGVLHHTNNTSATAYKK